MKLNIRLFAALAFAVLSGAASPPPGAMGTGMKIVDRIAAGGEGGWDYVSIDQPTRKIYITRGASIMSVDADTGKPTLAIAVTNRSHQVVPINSGTELLVTNGGDSTVSILDARSGKARVTTSVSAGPDAAILEPTSGLVLVIGHKSGAVDLLDPKSGALVGSIAVGGTLEYAVADGRGKAFVNVEDKGEIVAIDIKTRHVIGHYAIAGCEEPTGLAYLAPNDLLLAACGNGVAAFVAPRTGAVVQMLTIGAGADAAFYDDIRKLAFIPSGATGTLAVIHVDGHKARIVDTVATAKGARLGMVDVKTGRVYLPAARYAPPVAAGARPTAIPNSFEILVVGK